jgi:hypothetical protein
VIFEVAMAITDVACVALAEREIELVVAVTPTGALAHAIDAYRQAVAVRVGKNSAHDAPPHCVVARSYDEPSTVRAHEQALTKTVLHRARQPLDIEVTALATEGSCHWLEIESPSLRALALGLAASGMKLTRPNPVTAEGQLRLVLAADFAAEDRDALSELAHRVVDPTLPAQWDVGVWERSKNTWTTVWSAAAR